MVKVSFKSTLVLICSFHFFSGTIFSLPQKAPEFYLQSPQGKLSLSQLKGQVVLIFFGFTACPDVCPISLSTISRVFHEMEEEE